VDQHTLLLLHKLLNVKKNFSVINLQSFMKVNREPYGLKSKSLQALLLLKQLSL
jgi:hypothetical protein